MESEKVTELLAELRPKLLELGLKTTQIAYHSKRINDGTQEEIIDAYYFLQEIRDIHFGNYEKHIKAVKPELWKHYEVMGYGPDSGIWEIRQKIRLRKEIVTRWTERPWVLTRQPNGNRPRPKIVRTGKRTNRSKKSNQQPRSVPKI